MVAASIKRAWVVWASWLALPACGRLGFQEHALAVAGASDAGALDSDTLDSSAIDAGTDAAANSCRAVEASDDYCRALPHLDHVPVIDGRPECGLPLRTFAPQGWVGVIPSISSDQGTPRFALAWHEQGIYVYLEIVDGSLLPPLAGTEIWCGDSAEAYVDSDGKFASATMYDNPGTSQFIATPPSNNPLAPLRAERFRDGDTATGRPWSTPNHTTFITDKGYGLEAFITAPDLDLDSWTLHAGDTVGVDVSANVSLTPAAVNARQPSDCGTRAGQWFLRSASSGCLDKACAPYRNTSAFCTPTLR